ncbi:MAG: hypothetical protein RIC06_23965 [Cyclobacteriaceae bacterium]
MLLFILGCSQKEKKEVSKPNIIKPVPVATKPHKTNEGKVEYLKLLEIYNKRRFSEFDRYQFQFNDKYPRSVFIDSVRALKNLVVSKRDSLLVARDSLKKINSLDYFHSLNLPSFDTINNDTYNLWSYQFPNEFIEVDRDLFSTDFYQSWYLSQHPLTKNRLTISVAHYNDCENYIYLYSMDSQFQVIDKKEIYRNGCFMSEEEGYLYDKYSVEEHDFKTTTYFHNDSTFTIQEESIYQLTDTNSGNKLTKTGINRLAQYHIDDYGRIVEIDKKIYTETFVQKQ